MSESTDPPAEENAPKSESQQQTPETSAEQQAAEASSEQAPAAASEGASSDDLAERLGKVQSDLAMQQKQLHRSAVLTAVVGAILLLLLTGYFVFGWKVLSDFTEPEKLVNDTTQIILARLPDARISLQDEIEIRFPVVLKDMSDQIQKSIPELREEAENEAVARSEQLIGEFVVMTEDQFRKVLKENRPTLEKLFDELGESPELSQESLTELQEILDSQLQTKLEEQMHFVHETMAILNGKLKKLRRGKNLNREERLERRVLMLARRLQLENENPSRIGQPIPMPSIEDEEEEERAKGLGVKKKPDGAKKPADKKKPAGKKKPEPPKKPAGKKKPESKTKKKSGSGKKKPAPKKKPDSKKKKAKDAK